jgi:NAD(P)-dependent dehydrogenase (short-subunit alcohol dehydrogenase family)
MDLGLSGRRAIVTGGSKGLGFAIAGELLREGASVAICSRRADELAEAAEELAKEGQGTVFAQGCDVTVPAQVIAFAAAAAEALGGVDILVNNAGAAHPGRFETLTDEDWYGDYDVKLMSQVRCTRAALPRLRRSAAPRVININAVYARYPDPVFLTTSANRAACQAMGKALSVELAADGILVNSVNIGYVVTPQWDNIHRRRAPELPAEEFFAQLAGDEVPLRRFGRPEEVSGLVAFLAGDRASYITGASIDIAGGMGKYLLVLQRLVRGGPEVAADGRRPVRRPGLLRHQDHRQVLRGIVVPRRAEAAVPSVRPGAVV